MKLRDGRSDESRAKPLISLVVIAAPTPLANGARAVVPVSASLDKGWEVVFVSGSAVSSSADALLRRVVSSSDTLSGAMNDGISRATGEYVVFIGPDQMPNTVLAAKVFTEIAKRPKADVVYFDDAPRARTPGFIKPAFSPERLRNQDYFGDFVAYRRDFLLAIGAGRPEARGSELYDLALRSSRAAVSISNSRIQISRAAKPLEASWYPEDAVRQASTKLVLQEHLDQTGGGVVEKIGANGIHRTRRSVKGTPLVSIVIPTGGTSAVVLGMQRVMVVEAVRGIMNISTYTNFEFVFVVDATTPAGVQSELRAIAGERATFVNWSEPFSFSGKMNLGVLQARGEFVLILNDDVELITPDWIESMLALAQLPLAGTVGAMLYFEDDTIQHAGHAYYRLNVTHIGLNSERGAAGPSGGFLVEREVAGNTAACCMMTRELFLKIGGFSTLLPGNFNDVDLCMKVSTLGHQSYWTPYAELHHFESKSRDPRVSASEVRTTWGRWEHLFYDSDLWPTDPHEGFARERLTQL
jgi:GT2 family glycosyltransferase